MIFLFPRWDMLVPWSVNQHTQTEWVPFFCVWNMLFQVRNLKYRPALEKVLCETVLLRAGKSNGWPNKRWDVFKTSPQTWRGSLGSTSSMSSDMKVGYKTMWTRQLFSNLRWFGGLPWVLGKHPKKVISNLGFCRFFCHHGSFLSFFLRKESNLPCDHCSSCRSLTDVLWRVIPGSDRNSAFCWELCKVWRSGYKSKWKVLTWEVLL